VAAEEQIITSEHVQEEVEVEVVVEVVEGTFTLFFLIRIQIFIRAFTKLGELG
jgi:hypothetical protein